MLALVSTLADELNIMKQRSIMTGGTYDMYQRTGNTDALINVSDDEEDDEEDEDEDEEQGENDYYGDEDIMDNIILEEIIDNVPFAIVEEAPVFPGCKGNKAENRRCLEDKIREHVNKHYNIGLSTDLGLTAGKKKVYVQFKIDKNGNITESRARGPHKRLEKEALRVVNKLPKMTPGKQRGKPVGVSYTLPITLIVVN